MNDPSLLSLDELRVDVEKVAAKVKTARIKFKEEEHQLSLTIEKYNLQREVFFQKEIKRSGIYWCTRCYRIFPTSELKFLYFVLGQKEKKSGHYFADGLQRVCQECDPGRYTDSSKLSNVFKSRVYFLANVNDNGKGFWVGNREIREYRFPVMTIMLRRKLEKIMNIPPVIDYCQF